MLNYPVNAEVISALDNFPKIKSRLLKKLSANNRSDLEIVRLLNNLPAAGPRQLLQLINDYIDSAGDIGKNLLHEKDLLCFRRILSELYMLAYFKRIDGLDVKGTVSKSNRIHDIDLELNSNRARIEIFCPLDFFGFQFIKTYTELEFRYCRCTRGFSVSVELLVAEDSGFHAYQIPNDDKTLRKWLKNLHQDVNEWLPNAEEGSEREFAGINDEFCLKATLEEIHPNPEHRYVQFNEPTRSNDTQHYFEKPLTVEYTAHSQIGNKIKSKLEKRQCGDPSPDYLRILVVDFRLMDVLDRDWFCRTHIAERMTETVRTLSDCIGPPIPFDVVIPVRLDFDCCFGEAVLLDQDRKTEMMALMRATELDRKCQPLNLEQPPPELIAAFCRCESDSDNYSFSHTWRTSS